MDQRRVVSVLFVSPQAPDSLNSAQHPVCDILELFVLTLKRRAQHIRAAWLRRISGGAQSRFGSASRLAIIPSH
ncbi:hypothetical protein BPTFM16_01301 [Altererythrobacter insulae]|nr:hypothetical protein BPTFM16_01301 [Altererythrobacter insulae]